MLIGENSRLTKSLSRVNSKFLIVIIKKSKYLKWRINKNNIVQDFKEIDLDNGDIILINKALTNPSKDVNEVEYWNLFFPITIIEQISTFNRKIKVFTTGSIHESSVIKNNYLISKNKLSKYVSQFNSNNVSVTHLRFNTLYGLGMPQPNMFLGQIFKSIKLKEIFLMTSGKQLRQYHHYDDISKHLFEIFYRKNNLKILEFFGDEWISLKNLALMIYKSFNLSYLLKIGYLEEPNAEIHTKINTEKKIYKMRPLFPSVIKYLNEALK